MTTKVTPITVVAACGDQMRAASASCQRALHRPVAAEPGPRDAPERERDERRRATHAGACSTGEPSASFARRRHAEQRHDAQAAEVEADRRDDVSPLARAEAGDRAEHAGAVDVGAEAEQRAADHRPAADRVARRHLRQQVQRLGDDRPPATQSAASSRLSRRRRSAASRPRRRRRRCRSRRAGSRSP